MESNWKISLELDNRQSLVVASCRNLLLYSTTIIVNIFIVNSKAVRRTFVLGTVFEAMSQKQSTKFSRINRTTPCRGVSGSGWGGFVYYQVMYNARTENKISINQSNLCFRLVHIVHLVAHKCFD